MLHGDLRLFQALLPDGVLDRFGCEFRRHVGKMLFFAIGTSGLAVVHRKRTEHFPLARHDWSRPAGSHANRDAVFTVIVPKRIDKNVADAHRRTAKHSCSARTML